MIADSMKIEIVATGVVPGQFYRAVVRALNESPELANIELIVGGAKPCRSRRSYLPYARLHTSRETEERRVV